LHGLSLNVADSEVVALLGRNGAGKTTTLRCIAGLTPPRRGAIRYQGRSIAGDPPHRIARMGIALVPETRDIFSYLTVKENLVIGQRAGSRWRMETVLERFPRLAERLAHKGRELSGGEQQMLAIARALLTGPELLLLDEPSQGLAPLVVSAVMDTIRGLKAERVSMLLVEQNAEMALQLAGRAARRAAGYRDLPRRRRLGEQLGHAAGEAVEVAVAAADRPQHGLRLGDDRRSVERLDLAVLDHHHAVDDDGMDARAGLREHHLLDRVVEGRPRRRVEVVEYDVGAVSGLDAPDAFRHPHRPRPALGRHRERLPRAHPPVAAALRDPAEHRRQADRLVQHQVVVGDAAVGAERHGHAGGEHLRDRRDAGAELEVAFGVVHHHRAGRGEALDVPVFDPDRVRARKPRAQQAEALELLHHGAAVAALREAGLDLRFQ